MSQSNTHPGTASKIVSGAMVAIFNFHIEAEAVIKVLQRSYCDLKKLSIVGSGYHTDESAVGYYNAGVRMKYLDSNGAFWGGLWSMPLPRS